MDDIYVYFVALPDGINEMVTPCDLGYTVYLDINLDEHQRKKAYFHALEHIKRNDFGKDDVQEIEAEARR